MKPWSAGLISTTCVLILAGCGYRASATSDMNPPRPSASPTPAPSSSMAPSPFLNCLEPGHDYDAPASPPVPQRLTVDRLCGQSRLQAVPLSVTARVSGAAAYARCDRCDKSTNLTEELAYYSAATPGTMPAGCEPAPNVPMPAVCSGPGTPVYDRRLVWFFVAKTECVPIGPAPLPGHTTRPFQAIPCVWFAPMDASNGTVDFTTSG